MRRIPRFIVAGIAVLALSAGAVGIAQAMSGESPSSVADAQKERAAHAALDVVNRGQIVSIAHDDEGMAEWEVRVFKPTQVDGFGHGPTVGRHVVVYLDRDFNWLQAKVEGYGPKT